MFCATSAASAWSRRKVWVLVTTHSLSSESMMPWRYWHRPMSATTVIWLETGSTVIFVSSAINSRICSATGAAAVCSRPEVFVEVMVGFGFLVFHHLVLLREHGRVRGLARGHHGLAGDLHDERHRLLD